VFFGERLRQLARVGTRLQASSGVPAEVEEAAAALQALAARFAPRTGAHVAAAEVAQLEAVEREAGCAICCSRNGPYLVRNVRHLENSLGEVLPTRPEMALCRCGGSANKPFCDGTHARNGFSSQKLPGRVADRRDDYVREELTVHDNRGICQHAGFCTDKLAAVFRAHAEPFVDLGGADKDAIIQQVRQCPSGALSYSIDGVEYRDQDREPTITVSKDGPYRVTGGIDLPDEARAEGASTEHYALCRCGGSKNKPFCDGTHWYIKFRDDKN